jgi:hypothetical protein
MELLPWLACSLEWFSTTKYMFFCVYQNAKMAASAEQSFSIGPYEKRIFLKNWKFGCTNTVHEQF